MKTAVTFLLDRSNNWIEETVSNGLDLVPRDRFTIRIAHDHEQVADQDIVFILGYTRLLDAGFLARNNLNLVIHESALPEGRGFAPVQWQVLEGRSEIPITLLEAAAEADAGDIVLQSSFTLAPTDLYDDIRRKQANATLALIEQFLFQYPRFERTPQRGEPSRYRRRTANDDALDPDRTIRAQFNQLRIANNDQWPAYFMIDGEKFILRIERASDQDQRSSSA
jgi:methionyl-tRNA formyltransferase